MWVVWAGLMFAGLLIVAGLLTYLGLGMSVFGIVKMFALF
jgi:hypothetical protein